VAGGRFRPASVWAATGLGPPRLTPANPSMHATVRLDILFIMSLSSLTQRK
jgi:hypothetical protein